MRIIVLIKVLLITGVIYGQNVGINTTNPQGQLHIETTSSLSKPHLRLTQESTDYSRIKFENNVHLGSYWDIAGRTDTIAGIAKLNFYYNSPYSTGDRMTITGNGKVGIGTTNPISKLDIQAHGHGSELLRLSTERPWVFKQTGSGFQSKLTLQATYGNKTFEIVSSDSSLVTAAFRTNDIDPGAYLVPAAGRVGVGTYNPNARMNIHGNPNSTENLLRIWTLNNSFTDIRGIDCESRPAEGYGIGGDFRGGYRGVRGLVDGNNSPRSCIGVVGAATGTNNNGTRIGLWGDAAGGQTNWAGYFDRGNIYMKNELRIGSGAINGATGYKVAVDGKIIAEEIRVQLSGAWPDYVFQESYDLMPLETLERSIAKNNHLPGVPSAAEVAKNGIIVGEMQTVMMEKIEELTLYILALNKELQEVKQELEQVQRK